MDSNRNGTANGERAADGLDARGRWWIERYQEAWAARDIDSLLDPLTPECDVFYPLMAERTDKAGLHAFYDWCYSILPDFVIRPLHWAQNGDDILIEWRGSATVAEELFEWNGGDRFRFDADGRIVECRSWWDTQPLLVRLGLLGAAVTAPPHPPSEAEAAAPAQPAEGVVQVTAVPQPQVGTQTTT